MLNNVNIALRYEELESGLNYVLEKAGEKRKVNLPRKNITPDKKHYTEYYNLISRKTFFLYFKNELAKFCYSFQEKNFDNPIINLE